MHDLHLPAYSAESEGCWIELAPSRKVVGLNYSHNIDLKNHVTKLPFLHVYMYTGSSICSLALVMLIVTSITAIKSTGAQLHSDLCAFRADEAFACIATMHVSCDWENSK